MFGTSRCGQLRRCHCTPNSMELDGNPKSMSCNITSGDNGINQGVEAGTRLRAAVVDMRGSLNLKDWEQSSSSQMGHVWLTDCDSLYEHLISPKNNSVDNKRLAIDLMALRQYVWERNGERSQYIEHSSGDYPR